MRSTDALASEIAHMAIWYGLVVPKDAPVTLVLVPSTVFAP